MIDDLLSLKAAAIGREVSHARAYALAPNTFAANLLVQNAALLNPLRASDAALHTSDRLIHDELLSSLQSARIILMSVETLPLPQLEEKRPKLGLPRGSVGAIKLSMLTTPPA